MSVALALLSAHLLADFPLQTDKIAANKLDNANVRSIHVMIHMLMTLLFVGLAVGPSAAITATFFVAIFHFVIDSRRWAKPKDGFELYPIAVDQSLHITSLFLVSLLL